MRYSCILYIINEHPAGGETVMYVKNVTLRKVTYTSLKREAKRFGILKSLFFSIIYGFSSNRQLSAE